MGFDSGVLCISYMEIVMIIEFPTVLEPNNFRSGFASGHTNEHYLVPKDVFVIKMGGLYNAGTLKKLLF